MAGRKDLPEEVEDVKPIVVLGGIMIAITILGILLVCCVRLTMNCICVTFEVLTLIALSVVLILFGAVLAVPAFWGVGYIRNNCDLISYGKIDEIDQYSIRVFEPISELDKAFQSGVNKQMCSKFCTCPGSINSKHFKQYREISDEEYKKYDRTFYPELSDDELNDLKRTNPTGYRDAIMKDKSLHWLPEGEDGDGKITIDTMLKCYDEAVKI